MIPGYERDLEIVERLFEAVAAFTGKSKISIRELGRMVGVGLFQPSTGHHFSIESFKTIVSYLEKLKKSDSGTFIPTIGTSSQQDFMNRLTLEQRQEKYAEALDTIRKYMRDFGKKYSKNWGTEHVTAYHIINLLKRNLGFEILSFTTLDKDSFVKDSKNLFHRHHYRNDFFRKLSKYTKDLLLTDKKNHPKYESYSEAEIVEILKGFDKMMDMKGSGIDGAITKNDVINIFTKIFPGNEWVLTGKDGKTGWFSSEQKFSDMLAEFNRRKNILQNEGLDEFIAQKYNTVYERFYLNYPHGSGINIADADGFYMLVVPQPTLGDFAMWMNFEAGFYDYFYPVY